jgi:hypothetical protein
MEENVKRVWDETKPETCRERGAFQASNQIESYILLQIEMITA